MFSCNVHSSDCGSPIVVGLWLMAFHGLAFFLLS